LHLPIKKTEDALVWHIAVSRKSIVVANERNQYSPCPSEWGIIRDESNEIGKACDMIWQKRDDSVTRLARRDFYLSSGVMKKVGKVGVYKKERRRGTATLSV
jgi:hypothetical protein